MRAHAGRYFGVATFGSQVGEEQRPNQRVIVIQSSTRIALAAINLLRNALKVLLDCQFTLRNLGIGVTVARLTLTQLVLVRI